MRVKKSLKIDKGNTSAPETAESYHGQVLENKDDDNKLDELYKVGDANPVPIITAADANSQQKEPYYQDDKRNQYNKNNIKQ